MKNNVFLYQLSTFFDVYLPEIRRASKNTCASYADSFAIFFDFLYAEKHLSHNRITYKLLTPKLFDEFVLWMTNCRQYSTSSIHQRISAISSFLKYASRREMSALGAYTNVAAVEYPRKTQVEFPYFTLNEMRILLALPDCNKYLGDRDLIFLSVLYETAARAQEICDLTTADIRFGKPTRIKLCGKGNKTRSVAISEDVSNLLRYHFKQHNLKSNTETPLFSSQSNKKMTTACVRSIVSKYVSMAKCANPALFLEKNYSPHSFRHSKAVHMIESGVSLVYIRNYLGHASISSTEIYARVGEAAVAKALAERNIPNITATAPQTDSVRCTLPEFISRNR